MAVKRARRKHPEGEKVVDEALTPYTLQLYKGSDPCKFAPANRQLPLEGHVRRLTKLVTGRDHVTAFSTREAPHAYAVCTNA